MELLSTIVREDRLLILGGPGSGKTTLMKSLLSAVIEKRCDPGLIGLLPVLITLRKLSSKGQTVQQAIVSFLAEHRYPKAERYIDALLRQGRMLIIMDGLDEVGANREFVTERIMEFCEADSLQVRRNRVIVTCREASYKTEDLRTVIPSVVRVEPFANHHIRIFLQGWPAYKGRVALRLYGLIQGDAQIRDICRNPLLLTILTGLYLDTDDFELPSSRELFYRTAIDELMIKRPARRLILQKFSDADKRRILEGTALQKLQTLRPSEDPETFTRDSLLDISRRIVGGPFEPEVLIHELTTVNGIIKTVGDELYTFAHRTVQEYLAAREATRVLTTEEIVAGFWGRPDLSEVLFFSCGLIHNIPQLRTIVRWCMSEQDWNGATKCLLNMAESVGAAEITNVVDALYQEVGHEPHGQLALELLSSLGQRHGHDYDVARAKFFEAIDLLTKTRGDSSLPALESALSTSPETAMAVIPVLMEHPSASWRKTAVRLLRDIGTDEAIDQLVQLVGGGPSTERNEAGLVLSGMLKTRRSDLIRRIDLFPQVPSDNFIWPLKFYCPSRIGVAIASAVADGDKPSNNRAIDCAAAAIRYQKGLTAVTPWNERDWRLLRRHMLFRSLRLKAGKGLASGAYFATMLALVVFFAAELYARSQSAVFLWDGHLEITVLRTEPIRSMESHAKALVEAIETRFPPKATGAARILPWNWLAEPILQEQSLTVYRRLKGLSFDLSPWQLSSGFERPDRKDIMALLPDSGTEIATFYRSLREVAEILIGISAPFLLFGALSLPFTLFLMFATAMGIYVSIGTRFRLRVNDPSIMRLLPGILKKTPTRLMGFTSILLSEAFFTIGWCAVGGEAYQQFSVTVCLPAAIALGAFLTSIPWPRNQYFDSVEDVSEQLIRSPGKLIE